MRATGFWVGCLPNFFSGFGRLEFPDGFHLFAAIGFPHVLVIEGVAGFLSLAAQMMVSVAWVK